MRKLLALLSWRNWGIFRYNSIWQNMAALFYIALVEELFSLAFIGLVLLFTAFSTLMTGFGYLVNDLADRDVDLSQGKGNAFANVSTLTAVLIIMGALGVGIFLGWPFMAQPWFSVLWLLWVLCAVFYSLPPLRLKERGLSGLVVTIAAQQTLPTAMLFAIFGQLFSPGALVFVLFATVRGISSDVSHQMRDAESDRASGIKTFAVHHGEAAVQAIYAVSLELERLFLGAVYILLLVELPALRIPWTDFWLSLGWPLFLFYLPLFVLTVGSSLRALRQGILRQHDPYNELRQMSQRDALHVIHHTLPTVLTPLYLGMLLSIAYWPNLIFLVVLFMLYGLYSPSRWADTWPLRSLLAYQRGQRSRS